MFENKKVVCITTHHPDGYNVILIKKDKIYTSLGHCNCGECDETMIKLKELPDYSFSYFLFRPLNESFAEEVLENVQKNIKEEERELVEFL